MASNDNFANYYSLIAHFLFIVCDAAAIIDRSSNGDQPFKRGNNKQKAQFNEETSVFIRNLPADVTDDDLFQEFQKTGSVINCQVS